MKHIFTVQHTQSIHHTNGMVGSWTDWDLTELGRIQADHIGIYSTEEKARDAIQSHKDLEGFKDLPLECFEIHEYELDRSSWNDGFTTVRYGK